MKMQAEHDIVWLVSVFIWGSMPQVQYNPVKIKNRPGVGAPERFNRIAARCLVAVIYYPLQRYYITQAPRGSSEVSFL